MSGWDRLVCKDQVFESVSVFPLNAETISNFNVTRVYMKKNDNATHEPLTMSMNTVLFSQKKKGKTWRKTRSVTGTSAIIQEFCDKETVPPATGAKSGIVGRACRFPAADIRITHIAGHFHPCSSNNGSFGQRSRALPVIRKSSGIKPKPGSRFFRRPDVTGLHGAR